MTAIAGTLQTLRWADELGFSEAWIGEHHNGALGAASRARPADCAGADGNPAHPPRPGRLSVAYHHPAELANRVAMLDHMAQGRLNFGSPRAGLPSDWAMFNVDGNAGQHREMIAGGADIILKLWSATTRSTMRQILARDPDRFDAGTWRPHIAVPEPHPPIGVAGVSKGRTR